VTDLIVIGWTFQPRPCPVDLLGTRHSSGSLNIRFLIVGISEYFTLTVLLDRYLALSAVFRAVGPVNWTLDWMGGLPRYRL
jgi:hypothetical protein